MNGARDRFAVVLVEPGDSLNVGAVARAMMNLGFRDLRLVAPRDHSRHRARITAVHAAPLLDTLTVHDRFEDALADVEEAVGLSGRAGGGRPNHVTLPEWSADLAAGPARRTALVFGPEDNGLRQEHLDLCRHVVRIPSDEECPSFNLSQAVLLVLYEITRALPVADAASPEPAPPDAPTGNDYAQLDRIVESVMRRTGFLREGTPAPVPGTVRGLLRRPPMSRQEMGILLGLFGRIDRTLGRLGAGPRDDE